MNEPSEVEINKVLDACSKAEAEGSAYAGMTYEQGIADAILWMQGQGDNPLIESH